MTTGTEIICKLFIDIFNFTHYLYKNMLSKFVSIKQRRNYAKHILDNPIRVRSILDCFVSVLSFECTFCMRNFKGLHDPQSDLLPSNGFKPPTFE